MKLINISGKSINIEGLKMSEKEFISFFSAQKPFKEMIPKDRIKALKEGYKVYKKNTIEIKKEEL